MPQVTIKLGNEDFDIEYIRNDVNAEVFIEVKVLEERIKEYTGANFTIKINHNIVSYPLHGFADKILKEQITTEIFKKEQIIGF